MAYRIPLEFFLTLNKERDAIAQIRQVGTGFAIAGLFVGGFFATINKGAAGACFVGAGIGAVAASYKQKRFIELERLLDNVETYEVEARQDSVVSHLGGGKVEVVDNAIPVQTAELEPSIAPVDLRSFRFHHLMVLGPTGWGKSTFAGYLLDHLSGDIVVVDPHATPRTWGDLPVAGIGRNYQEIKAFIKVSEQEMIERYERRTRGDESYRKLTIVVDEFPAIAKSIGSEEFKGWVQTMLCEARKVNISLILLSQGKSVKTLGLEGQSELLENLTILRGGSFAKKYARSLKDDAMVDWLSQQQRPAMLDDDGVTIPDLSGYEPRLDQKPSSDLLRLLGSSINTEKIFSPQREKVENFPTLEKAENIDFRTLPGFPDFSDVPVDAIKQALENGKPDSYIVMDILGYKGRKYGEGKKILDQIKGVI